MDSVTIDNIDIKVSSQSTILEACHSAGIIVPRFCFHKKLRTSSIVRSNQFVREIPIVVTLITCFQSEC